MDSPPRSLTWAPEPKVLGAGWALTAVAVVTALLLDDPRGRLLLAVAALALALLSLSATMSRPRLAADSGGVTVRGIAGTRRWSWAEVNVRLVVHRRLGREVSSVEIDAEHAERPGLVVLGRLDLGEDPQEVTAALLALRT